MVKLYRPEGLTHVDCYQLNYKKMKNSVLIITLLLLMSCQLKVVETKLEIHYINGETEILTVTHNPLSSRIELEGGCLYRIGHRRNQIRCGINYTKKLSEVNVKPTN